MTLEHFKSLIENSIGINVVLESDGRINYSASVLENESEWEEGDEKKKIMARNATLNEEGWVGTVVNEYGASGGSCWGDDAEQYDSYPIPYPFIEKILSLIYCELDKNEVDGIYYNIHKEIPIESTSYSNYEWYGNYSTYNILYVNILRLYEFLSEKGIIKNHEKEAVIIGGLPLSGKTTLAKSVYHDFHLIDDPRDLEADVLSQLQDKTVITCPHLSFKDNRENLKEMLVSRGFKVYEYILDVDKYTLERRAKKDGRKDRLQFIRKFKIEK